MPPFWRLLSCAASAGLGSRLQGRRKKAWSCPVLLEVPPPLQAEGVALWCQSQRADESWCSPTGGQTALRSFLLAVHDAAGAEEPRRACRLDVGGSPYCFVEAGTSSSPLEEGVAEKSPCGDAVRLLPCVRVDEEFFPVKPTAVPRDGAEKAPKKTRRPRRGRGRILDWFRTWRRPSAARAPESVPMMELEKKPGLSGRGGGQPSKPEGGSAAAEGATSELKSEEATERKEAAAEEKEQDEDREHEETEEETREHEETEEEEKEKEHEAQEEEKELEETEEEEKEHGEAKEEEKELEETEEEEEEQEQHEEREEEDWEEVDLD